MYQKLEQVNPEAIKDKNQKKKSFSIKRENIIIEISQKLKLFGSFIIQKISIIKDFCINV